MLSGLLIDQLALRTRMRNCRWNVTGPQQLRGMFASHEGVLGEMLDDIAMRPWISGPSQTAALVRFCNLAWVKIHPGVPPRASEITPQLLAGHESVIWRLRENLVRCSEVGGEMVNRDFMNKLLEKHEKMAAELLAIVGKFNQ